MVRKNYKKFVATAATATLVASAIAPVASADVNTAAFTDVPASYKDAVDFLVSNNIATGKSETQFDIHGNITRGDFAAILARAAGLIDADAPSAGFTDVPESRALIVSSLKDAGVINGISDTQFGYAQNIKRGDAAKMITKAFDLETSDEESKFTDVSAGYEEAVNALVKAGVTNGKSETQFGVHDNIKRGDFAKWIHALEDYVVDQDETPGVSDGITSVKAINDTKLEVTFGKAIDEDLAVEIEKSGERFVVYHGGQTANSKAENVIKSKTINFSDDRKTAEIILENDPAIEEDVNYKVALMDGDNNEVSSVVHESTSQILKKGAEKPSIEVNKSTDKVVLDFKTKMDEAAKDKANYTIYENDKEVGSGDLADFVEEGEWVDSTTKQAVEFKLKKDEDLTGKGLLAGKTYKIKVDEDEVETDDGKSLSSSQKTITFKTPTVSEAQPVAKIARVTEASENDGKIVVTFDKDLSKEENFNASQFTVKKPGGNSLDIDAVNRVTGSDNEIEILLDEEVDRDLTYTIDIPANGVNNAYFANASNKETKGLKAQAQKDIEIKSMSAKFEQDASNKKRADLYLTFDQRPNVESIDNVVIKEGSDTWDLNVSGNVKLYSGDATGKTVVIEDVTKLDPDFTIKSDKNYTVEIPATGVQVDAGSSAKTNQEKLKATTKGVSINSPAVDTVRLVSADEIEIEFKENIDTRNLKASDVKVSGFETFKNGNFTTESIMLQGDSQIKVTSSGKKMTLRTADKDVNFVTSFEDLEFEIAADTFKNSVSNLENNDKLVYSELDLDSGDKVDRAKPVMVGAEKVDTEEITITYTEAVNYKGSDEEKQASQFSVDKASKAAYGESTSTSGNKVRVTFNEAETFKSDLDLAKVQVKYAKNSNVFLKDLSGNEADRATLIGIKSDGSSIGGGLSNDGQSVDQAYRAYTEALESVVAGEYATSATVGKALENYSNDNEAKDKDEMSKKDMQDAVKDLNAAVSNVKAVKTATDNADKAKEAFEEDSNLTNAEAYVKAVEGLNEANTKVEDGDQNKESYDLTSANQVIQNAETDATAVKKIDEARNSLTNANALDAQAFKDAVNDENLVIEGNLESYKDAVNSSTTEFKTKEDVENLVKAVNEEIEANKSSNS